MAIESPQKQPSSTFTVVLDDDVTAYLEHQGITDISEYVNGLLLKEQQRQQQHGELDENDLDDLNDATPDASGYPEMTGHFEPSPNQ